MSWLLAVAGVALLCPVTMFAPTAPRPAQALGAISSCMPAPRDRGTASIDEALRAKRDELDHQVAVLEASINEAGGELGIARTPAND